MGIGHSKETKLKLRLLYLGKPIPEKTRKKIIATKKANRLAGIKSKRNYQDISKPIICLETKIKYKSITACAKAMNLYGQNISAVLKDKWKTVKGFHFKYVKVKTND
jgi:hypothetical protein